MQIHFLSKAQLNYFKQAITISAARETSYELQANVRAVSPENALFFLGLTHFLSILRLMLISKTLVETIMEQSTNQKTVITVQF